MEILNYKAVNKGVCIGTFTIKVPKWGNFLIKEMSYLQKGETRWVSFPQRQYEIDGQKKYFAYVGFENFELTKKFQAEVLKVLDEHLVKIKETVASADMGLNDSNPFPF